MIVIKKTKRNRKPLWLIARQVTTQMQTLYIRLQATTKKSFACPKNVKRLTVINFSFYLWIVRAQEYNKMFIFMCDFFSFLPFSFHNLILKMLQKLKQCGVVIKFPVTKDDKKKNREKNIWRIKCVCVALCVRGFYMIWVMRFNFNDTISKKMNTFNDLIVGWILFSFFYWVMKM